MTLLALIQEYVFWHYTGGIRELLAISGNFIWFAYHFFSLKLFLRTLFSPFKRVRAAYHASMTLEEIAENMAANMFMRVVGIILRSMVLLLGGITELLIFLVSAVALFVWIFFPLVLIGLLGTALILVLSVG